MFVEHFALEVVDVLKITAPDGVEWPEESVRFEPPILGAEPFPNNEYGRALEHAGGRFVLHAGLKGGTHELRRTLALQRPGPDGRADPP